MNVAPEATFLSPFASVLTVADARLIYRQLRDRALDVSPGEAGYINALWAVWDASLAKFGDATELPEWMTWYRGTLQNAREDTVVEWLDAFPDAVEEQLRLRAAV